MLFTKKYVVTIWSVHSLGNALKRRRRDINTLTSFPSILPKKQLVNDDIAELERESKEKYRIGRYILNLEFLPYFTPEMNVKERKTVIASWSGVEISTKKLESKQAS